MIIISSSSILFGVTSNGNESLMRRTSPGVRIDGPPLSAERTRCRDPQSLGSVTRFQSCPPHYELHQLRATVTSAGKDCTYIIYMKALISNKGQPSPRFQNELRVFIDESAQCESVRDTYLTLYDFFFKFQTHFLLWHFWPQCVFYELSVVKVRTLNAYQ